MRGFARNQGTLRECLLTQRDRKAAVLLTGRFMWGALLLANEAASGGRSSSVKKRYSLISVTFGNFCIPRTPYTPPAGRRTEGLKRKLNFASKRGRHHKAKTQTHSKQNFHRPPLGGVCGETPPVEKKKKKIPIKKGDL